MRSRASSHVACGLNLPGASFNFAPFLAWGNAVPDSHATIDLVINETDLSFRGSGYHDQVRKLFSQTGSNKCLTHDDTTRSG